MAECEDEEEPLLINIGLLSENGDNTEPLGIIIIHSSQLQLNLCELRSVISNQVPNCVHNFNFCSKERWLIRESQEKRIKTHMIVTEKNVLYIKTKHDNPKCGIKTKSKGIIGFVFVNSFTPLCKLRDIISETILSMVEENYSFLDSNGWPIQEGQEHLFKVLDIINNSCISLDIKTVSLTNQDSISDDDTTNAPPRKKVKKLKELTFRSSKDFCKSLSHEDSVIHQHKQILISYVRAEAADHALSLKYELSSLGYSVYLDVHEIKSGVDWQDSLNYAVSNCQIFLPLITPRYGETQWTNREVKLADVLGKYILPINFLQTWPPRSLGIQFATTQFIGWKNPSQLQADIEEYGESYARDIRHWDKRYIVMVSQAIANRLQQIVDVDLERLPSLKRRKTLMKTFAGKLPNGIEFQISDESSSSEGTDKNIVICVHPTQKTFSLYIKTWLCNEGYNVWCSNEKDVCIDESDTLPPSQEDGERIGNGVVSSPNNNHINIIDNDYIQYFQEKADQAAVVIIIVSKEFTLSRTCQQQVFYCEQRKPVIPLQYEKVCLPGWLSMLIGSSSLQDVHQDGYQDILLSQIQRCIDPSAKDSIQMNINMAKISTAVTYISNTIRNPYCVYVSGSTKFYNKSSEEICRCIGAELAKLDNVSLVTGGFYGVGETVGRAFYEENQKLWKRNQVWHILPEKDNEDRRQQGRQGIDGKFQIVPFGKTLFCGESVYEKETLVAKVFDICLLIEGGPGAAHEVEEFVWNDRVVIPVMCTGGAAGGKFNVPDKIFKVPQGVTEADWLILRSKTASPEQIAKKISQIVQVLFKDLRRNEIESTYSPPSSKVLPSTSPQTPNAPSLRSMKTVMLSP